MSVRFRRSVTIFPGLRLNFSKSGITISLGRRGASITLGGRGTYANLGLPGTGLSYRTRLDVAQPFIPRVDEAFPVDSSNTPEPTFEMRLRNLLLDRELHVIDWADRALWLAEPQPNEEDEEAFEAYARRIAAARFARRIVEGDRAAWSEVIREELINEALPFDFGFEWGVEEGPERIYVGIELPPIEVVAETGLAVMRMRELHEDVSCALVLRFAHEIYRVIPEADELYMIGFQAGINPATGSAVREVYLRLATDRSSFDEVLLDKVDPSAAFEHLGGVSKRRRGQLQPLSVEPVR